VRLSAGLFLHLFKTTVLFAREKIREKTLLRSEKLRDMKNEA